MKTAVLVDVDGTLTDNTVRVDTDGKESLVFHKRDFWLIPEAKASGIEVVIHTSDKSTSIPAARAAKAGLAFHGVDGRAGKAALVRQYKDQGFRVVYIGDAPADVDAMREADEAWCPADAWLGRDIGWVSHDKSTVEGRAQYLLDAHHRTTVSHEIGGAGVLFDVLGHLLKRAA